MPQSNNAELTEVFTAETGVNVQSNQPNADNKAPTYDVRLQAVAGDPLGDSGSDYVLRIDCIDESLAQRNAALSIGPLNQTFAAPTWVKVGDDFKTEQRFTLTVPAGVEGHMFRYVATLVGVNDDVLSFIESDPYILVDP
jgi:hypothetical protein